MQYDERLTRMEVRGHLVPEVITPDTKDMIAYVVMGDTDHAGCVKPVRVSYSNSVPFLSADWGSTASGKRILKEIRVPIEYAKRGWFLLQRAYEVEGNEHGWGQWQSFQRACKFGRARHLKADKRIVPGFPNELLPKAVAKAYERRDPSINAWEPELPEAKKVGASEGKARA